MPPLYEELDDRFYAELEQQVEEAVRDAIQKARSVAAYVTKPDNQVRLGEDMYIILDTRGCRRTQGEVGGGCICDTQGAAGGQG